VGHAAFFNVRDDERLSWFLTGCRKMGKQQCFIMTHTHTHTHTHTPEHEQDIQREYFEQTE